MRAVRWRRDNHVVAADGRSVCVDRASAVTQERTRQLTIEEFDPYLFVDDIDTCECRDFLRSPKEPSAVEAALTVFENAIRERICQPSAKAEERCVVARDRYLAELRLDDLRSSAFRDSVIDRIEAGIPLVTKQPAQLPPERLLIVGLMTAGALAILTALLAMALVLFQ